MKKTMSVVFLVLVLAVAVGAIVQTMAARSSVPCDRVLCQPPDCGPGEVAEVPPGQCCPVCVPEGRK